MAAFAKLLSFVSLVALSFSSVSAVPWPAHSKHATHRTRRIVGREVPVEVENFFPKSSYQTFGSSGKKLSGRAPSDDIESQTKEFIASELGIDQGDIVYISGFTSSNGVSHGYVRQSVDGIPISNAVANVAFVDGRVTAFGSSFVDTSNVAAAEPSVDIWSILGGIESALGGSYNDFPVSLNYMARPDGSLSLVHSVQIQNEEAGSWYSAKVDAHSGDMLNVVDYVNDLTYTVIPIQKDAVTEGQETLVDPEDLDSSPNGWVEDGATAGNNVISYKFIDLLGLGTSKSSSDGTFDYPYDTEVGPTDGNNVDAARTNAFYVINRIHDFAYKYGWTEASFNFQDDNFDKGGEGGDRVKMSVQDISGTNNANFATPPDGQSGTCRMYVWTQSDPERDGSLQNDIIVHEFTHGITNRLTGGGTGECLQTTEAGGMGEGWSDAMSEWTEHKSAEVQDYVLAAWVYNNDAGIRSHPYSTDASVNPLRYSSIAELDEVHDIGEVWANTLHNVYAAFVDALGWSDSALDNPDGVEGNIVFMHLFIDALSLQPCNPTLPDARDAWVQADENRYSGANKCTIWKAFASRGLGVKAANYADDESVPDGC